MTVLQSGLETIDAGTKGWNNVHSKNMELIGDIDGKLLGPFEADNALGALQVTNSTTDEAKVLTDNTLGTPSDTIPDPGPTYDQATMRNIIASLVDEINNLRQDRENLKATINDLQNKQRKTNGCGVFND